MLRLGLLLPFLAAVVLQAAGSPAPCTNREIAFVQSFIGTWNDLTYKRLLAKNLSICSDSEVVRVRDGKQSEQDELILRDLFGGAPITFECADLLNCERPVQLEGIKAKLEQQLKGKTPGQSFDEFKRSHTGQTSTISRLSFMVPRDRPPENLWFQGVVVKAGEPLPASALTSTGALSYNYDFDLCLNADLHDCGTSRPKAVKYQAGVAALPFGTLPRGLHILYEVKMLQGDNVPLRTQDSAFILAVDPSEPTDALAEIKARLALAWIDPETTPAQLSGYAAYLASKAAH